MSIHFYFLLTLVAIGNTLYPCVLEPNDEDQLTTFYDYRSDSSPENEPFFETPMVPSESSGEQYKNFWEWKNACSLKTIKPPVTLPLLKKELHAFTDHFKKSTIM